jgi:hypothetical protein
MCYASPVMLRGRCSCAISGRPGTSSGTQTTRPTPSSAPRLPATRHSSLVTRHCSANSFVSPTSKKFFHKSFVSPTSAKTGGGGCYPYGNVSKICRRADIRSEEELKTRPPRPGRGRRQPRVGHRLTNGAPSAKSAIGLPADERPEPSSGRVARQIRRHCQATAAPCPCVRGIPGG